MLRGICYSRIQSGNINYNGCMIMTFHQWETVEKSLSSLTVLDKLELVERHIHEVRSAAATDVQMQGGRGVPLTENEFKQQLLKAGMMTSLPVPPDDAPRPEFQPVTIEGEPISETIIRERR